MAVVATSLARETQTRPTLVYVLAASHSGSTLLSLLLGSHPELCTTGELKMTSIGDIERYRCSCLKPILQCEFWSAVKREMQSRGIDFDIDRAGTDVRSGATAFVRRLLRPLHRGPLLEAVRDAGLALSPAWRRQISDIQLRNRELVHVISFITGKRFIVDSSKIGLRLKYLLRNRGFDVKVVRLVRDGRAVALTYTDPVRFADAQKPELRAGGMGGSRDSEKLSVAAAAHEWLRSNEEAEAVLATLPKHDQVQIRYEDLCHDPKATLQQAFTFLGVDPQRMVTEFRSVQHHVIGNGMRLDSSSEIRLDDRWREVFTARDLAEFDRVAGAMNRKLGYQ